MRITCNQCGKDLQSESCKRTCDENKRWEQFNEAQKELEKLADIGHDPQATKILKK